MLDRDVDLVTVTDLKQYDYCARVLFYEYCLPDFRPRTYKMDAGVRAHERERKLEARRTLSRFGLVEGEREFDVRLYSNSLHLHGIVDEVIVTSAGQTVYPVDYKLAKQVSHHYRLQLTAYAVMLEEMRGIEVSAGFLYLIPLRKAEKVTITPALREKLQTAVAQVRAIILHEHMPPPTKQRGKCINCEFRRVCNDV